MVRKRKKTGTLLSDREHICHLVIVEFAGGGMDPGANSPSWATQVQSTPLQACRAPSYTSFIHWRPWICIEEDGGEEDCRA
jgi:hypothetical protein